MTTSRGDSTATASPSHDHPVCKTEPATAESPAARMVTASSQSTNSHVIKYRIAIAASGEYSVFHGGTVAKAMDAIRETLQMVNEAYQRDLGIRLELVPENESVIFTDPQTDPFTSNHPDQTTLAQTQQTLDDRIGTGNYDLGILFNTAEFGLTYPRSVGDPTSKGKACIGSAVPRGPKFNLSYVAHEIAHMFGANHTFNSPLGHCGEFRSDRNAYEPGSGSTIMGYAGLNCGGDDIQESADGYFHAHNIFEIRNFVAQLTAGTRTPIENSPPSIIGTSKIYVPQRTPFQLDAIALDNETPTQLTYSWEQMDLGVPRAFTDPVLEIGPFVKSQKLSPYSGRSIPSTNAILNSQFKPWDDYLPLPGKYHFRLSVRDNHPVAGQVAFHDCEVEVVSGTSPFQITNSIGSPLSAGESFDVRWAVGGTDQLPIQANKVQITLSTNNGASFDFVLAAETENDGQQTVQLPSIAASQARLKVAALGKAFFAVSSSFGFGSSKPIICVQRGREKVTIWWEGQPAKKYLVQALDSPSEQEWTPVSPLLDGTEKMSWEENVTNHRQRIFRVRTESN